MFEKRKPMSGYRTKMVQHFFPGTECSCFILLSACLYMACHYFVDHGYVQKYSAFIQHSVRYAFLRDFFLYLELVEAVQSSYNCCVQRHVWLNTWAKMQQDNKGKYTLHRAAALSLSLSSFTASCLVFSVSWCFLYTHSEEKGSTDVIVSNTYYLT